MLWKILVIDYEQRCKEMSTVWGKEVSTSYIFHFVAFQSCPSQFLNYLFSVCVFQYSVRSNFWTRLSHNKHEFLNLKNKNT